MRVLIILAECEWQCVNIERSNSHPTPTIANEHAIAHIRATPASTALHMDARDRRTHTDMQSHNIAAGHEQPNAKGEGERTHPRLLSCLLRFLDHMVAYLLMRGDWGGGGRLGWRGGA